MRTEQSSKNVLLTVAHVWSAATIHIEGLLVDSAQSEIRELDQNFSLSGTIGVLDKSIRDDEIFRLDISMVNTLRMGDSHSLTHLGEHGCDEAEACPREEVRRVQSGKKTGCWRSVGCHGRHGLVSGRGRRVVVVSGLFQEIEEILSWNKLQE